MIDAIARSATNISGSPPRPASPLIQLASPVAEGQATQGETNDDNVEEIPNPENAKAEDEEEEVDRTTIVYDHNSDLIFYFLPIMPWMRALYMGDLSYISWVFKNFTNVKMLAQNFPRIIRFAKRSLTNGRTNDQPLSGFYNKLTFIDPVLVTKVGDGDSFFLSSLSNTFVESHTTNVEENSCTVNSSNRTVIETQNSTIVAQTHSSTLHHTVESSPSIP